MAKTKSKVMGLVSDYKAMFSSLRGKKILGDLMTKHYVMGSAHTPDPYESAHREGQRFVVLNIIEIMELDPSKYLTQLNETREENQNGNGTSHFNTE